MKRYDRGARGARLEPLARDIRLAVRTLWRDAAFSAASILVLAIALALNVTTFRVMEATVFHGFPLVQDNERLLFVDERYPTPACCVTYADYEVWRAEARSFQDMAFGVFELASVSESRDAVRDVSVGHTTANTFRLLGVAPAMGRDFEPADELTGAAPVVVVSHRYWMSRLGGRPDALGSVVQVDGRAATVVGVLPQGFDWPSPTEVWMPLEDTVELRQVIGNGSYVFGRLADGASEEAARAELEAINARLAIESPATNRDVVPLVRNFMDSFAGHNAKLVYGSLWAGAWLVIAIACANLANLALARAQRRAREMSTRMALGAGRGRVLRQWLLENLLLAAVAAVIAWVAMIWSTQAWAAATATPFRVYDYTPNLVTLVYLIAVTLCVAAVVTLAPMSRLWRLDVNGELKGETRGATMSKSAKRLSATLVAGQVALAIVLLYGAGVLGRSLWNVLSAPIGVQDPGSVLIGKFDLPRAKYPTPEARAAFFASVRARVADVPGIESAAIASGRPTDDYEPRPVEIEGQANTTLGGAPVFATGPGYFRTLGASVLAGREFNDADREDSTPVAIVNRSFAERYFPGANAVGQRIRLYQNRQAEPGEWLTIVGVSSNVMQNDTFRQRFVPVVYVPFAQQPTRLAWFLARAPNVFHGLMDAVRAEASRVDAALELQELATLKASLGFGLTQARQEYTELSKQAAIAPIFAGVALLLAAIGLYAVVARSVAQRTKEIGVRMALGAEARAIRRLVLVEGMVPTVIGLLVGIAGSLAVNGLLRSQLVGVSPHDILTLALSPLLLAFIALVGFLLPLRHAVSVDPTIALKHD